MIKLEGITKVYQAHEVETAALRDVNLLIDRGEFVSVMGPSGCGKSTLLNIIGMLDNPTRGKYWFTNQEVSDYTERRRTNLRKINIGFIFQSFNLIDDLTVSQNVELPLYYLGVRPAERKHRVDTILDLLNIGNRANHYPQQLSGGQQQRVAIARAMVANPKILLADEPTGNLDSAHGREVMEMLKLLNDKGTTILMVTHSPSHAEYGHRIVNLLDGRILSETVQDGYTRIEGQKKFF